MTMHSTFVCLLAALCTHTRAASRVAVLVPMLVAGKAQAGPPAHTTALLRQLTQLVDRPDYFDKAALERAFGIRLPPVNCVHFPAMQPAPEFICTSASRFTKVGLDVSYRYHTHHVGDTISNGMVTLGVHFKNACLQVSEVEAAFSKRAAWDASVFDEPLGGVVSRTVTKQFKFDTDGVDRQTFTVVLHQADRCVDEISVR